MFRADTLKPKDGFVKYHKSLSRGSDSLSTLHSAHPESLSAPHITFSRYFMNTVPLDIGVGGVPIMIVCGFGLAAIVYMSADRWSSVYSCASSMTSKSKLSPRPPVDVLVRKSIRPPSTSSICSRPAALIL